MRSTQIPSDVQKKVREIIEEFNRKTFGEDGDGYFAIFKGKSVYLDLEDAGPRCRLTYTGKMDDWKFALYRASKDRYDAKEWMFPVFQHLDGTIEGAMNAALEAYS